MGTLAQRRLEINPWLAPLAVLVVAVGLILSPPHSVIVPKQTDHTPWLFELLASWGERQSNLAWHRGGPEVRPDGRLNLWKHEAERSLARTAARLRPNPNYQLASTWLRFSLSLNNKKISNWRVASFLASLYGDIERARRYLQQALHHFPNHPLILLERAMQLGEYEDKSIHLEWAQQAYFAFVTMQEKPAIGLQDIRSFYYEYLRALRRFDRSFDQPQYRNQAIQLYEQFAEYEPIVKERSKLYQQLIAKRDAEKITNDRE